MRSSAIVAISLSLLSCSDATSPDASSGDADAGPSDTFQACQPGSLGAQGTLSDSRVEVAELVRSATVLTATSALTWFSAASDEGSYLLARGDIMRSGSSFGVRVMARLPGVAAAMDRAWYCGEGELTRQTNQLRFPALQPSTLGSCADKSGADQLSICVGPTCGATPFSISGSLEGQSISYSRGQIRHNYFVSGMGRADVSAGDPNLPSDAVLMLSGADTDSSGWLALIGKNMTDPWIVYCVPHAVATPTAGNGLTLNLTGIARLGSCPSTGPTVGTVEICYQR